MSGKDIILRISNDLLNRFNSGKKNRILAFGSSNTEYSFPGDHWFQWFELALKHKYGRAHTCINTGVGGDTSRDLLVRFEEDILFYKPHLAFLTIGGNDANPERNISASEYKDNLYKLYERFKDFNCELIFQTYYAPNADDCDQIWLKNIYHYMQIVREIATETDSMLIDHLPRWERLRINHNDIYISLMRDWLHVNASGSKVMGLDIARHFGIDFTKSIYTSHTSFDEVISIQKMMDKIGDNN